MPNYLGALPFSIGARRQYGGGGGGYGSAMTRSAQARANATAGFVRPDIAGTPARDAALLPAGFPIFSFVAATGTGIISQNMNPQTPFRGQRLTAVVIRAGATATTTAPILQLLLIGQKPILVTGLGVPLETFNQSAFDTNLLMPPTVPGVIYTMNISLSAAVTTTDTVTCLVAIIGSAVL
jgi:hypothetical protein